MLDSAIDDEAVACMHIENFSTHVDANAAFDNINKLMMRVAMTRTNPVGIEIVANEHELIGIGEHLTTHAVFGCKGFGILIAYEAHCFLRKMYVFRVIDKSRMIFKMQQLPSHQLKKEP